MIKSSIIEIEGSQPITIETGKLALLANASVVVKQGGTEVLVAVCSADASEGVDFLPLQVRYQEKYSAAGKFPGGFFKREGRPNEHEILTARMTDRPLRPLFPKGFYNEIQVQCLVLSADGEHTPDVLAMLGASAALNLSSLPFQGPLGSMRIGYINDKFIFNPTTSQMKESKLELIYSGLEGKTIMIEGDCDELSEEQLHEALCFADKNTSTMIAKQKELADKCSVKKDEYTLNVIAPEILDKAYQLLDEEELDKACLIIDKKERGKALNALFDKSIISSIDEEEQDLYKKAIYKITEQNIRKLILNKSLRSDGRGLDDLREISCETKLLQRTHGSALFSRGETQALVITTLGNSDDTQTIDNVLGESSEKKFYLHYNFPNYSVGECGRIAGPGNREVGHGNLAERSIAKMMPENYPYTVRCVSEIMGSNGSTSMASICGASLSLFDAGVKLKKAVAGISCGLVSDGDKYCLLTDILGSEDHYGDMDFKVAGTKDGITGFQLDLKIAGISLDLMKQALEKNKISRLKILDIMNECLSAPETNISAYAPQIHELQINPEKIGALIGPGGKVIKNIVETTGAKIDIEDSGLVKVFSANKQSLDNALTEINKVTEEVVIGRIYQGVVNGIKEFGAFVEVANGSGLLHISEMADYKVDNVEDICKVGDKITVKVMDIDNRGRIKLSRKAALEEMED